MKRFLFLVVLLLLSIFVFLCSYFIFGFYINLNNDINSFTSSDNENIYVNGEKFVIKGVNLSSGIPGYFAGDFSIDKKTYMRWFSDIQEMGANTIRVYTILSPEFYEAFYEYNKNRDEPLYLIHGVMIDDYVLNSKLDALDEEFQDRFLYDTKVMIDVIHGRRYVTLNENYGSGFYTRDISQWVIGYIIGAEWEGEVVSYTEHKYETAEYNGKYVSLKEGSSSFMGMLAYVLDMAISYESDKYNAQRLFAISNWPTTDPLEYEEDVLLYFKKCAKVDVESLEFSDSFIGGTFASYHVYPYYPDYLNYEDDKSDYIDKNGNINTYYAYLKKLNDYHTIPVVISEFGVSTGRGMAQIDINTGFNQGNMTEVMQGNAIVSMYDSIISSGSAGGIVFTWQDEWFKSSWNTMQNVDLNFTPYWSDVQTNQQHFGLLSFEPGKDKSISYIDGDISEWNDRVIVSNKNGNSISFQYDERYIYLMVKIKNYNGIDKIYIPIDTTDNSGSKITNISGNSYDRDIDFLIEINGKDNSRIYVHEYYDSLIAMFSENVIGKNIYYNPPLSNSRIFNKINLMLQTSNELLNNDKDELVLVYETGKLKYGNGNPSSNEYDSLSDFIINGDYIELRIPWQLLNFSNPSRMMIHDDYYKYYGIENKKIDKIYIGVGLENENIISLDSVSLVGWDNNVTYHERLKQSYFILKDYWTSDVE